MLLNISYLLVCRQCRQVFLPDVEKDADQLTESLQRQMFRVLPLSRCKVVLLVQSPLSKRQRQALLVVVRTSSKCSLVSL